MQRNPYLQTLLFSLALVATLLLSNLGSVRAQALPRLTPDSLDPAASRATYIPPGLPQSDRANTDRAIVGPDDRVAMTESAFPWSAIGKLVSPNDDGTVSTCTGTLIAPDIVLTNAHCIVDQRSHAVRQRIAFLPNLVRGRVRDDADVAWTTAVEYGTDFRNDGPNANSSRDDWGLLKLNQPLGEKYGHLGWRALDGDYLADYPETYIVVGYSGDFPEDQPGETASAHFYCSITGERGEVLEHTCDTMPGASGGPILTQLDGEYTIVGLHAGARVAENGQVLHNYAVKLARLDEWLAGQTAE